MTISRIIRRVVHSNQVQVDLRLSPTDMAFTSLRKCAIINTQRAQRGHDVDLLVPSKMGLVEGRTFCIGKADGCGSFSYDCGVTLEVDAVVDLDTALGQGGDNGTVLSCKVSNDCVLAHI